MVLVIGYRYFEGYFIMDHVIAGKFKLGRKIGSGSFGELYIGIYPCYFCLLFFEMLIVIFLIVVLFLCYYVVEAFLFFFVSAVNIQTGEEVAVKLVC